MKTKQIIDPTKEDLLMFIKMVILGFKCNPKMQGVGEELEKIFKERFNKGIDEI